MTKAIEDDCSQGEDDPRLDCLVEPVSRPTTVEDQRKSDQDQSCSLIYSTSLDRAGRCSRISGLQQIQRTVFMQVLICSRYWIVDPLMANISIVQNLDIVAVAVLMSKLRI
jgi:hypothetical protein